MTIPGLYGLPFGRPKAKSKKKKKAEPKPLSLLAENYLNEYDEDDLPLDASPSVMQQARIHRTIEALNKALVESLPGDEGVFRTFWITDEEATAVVELFRLSGWHAKVKLDLANSAPAPMIGISRKPFSK